MQREHVKKMFFQNRESAPKTLPFFSKNEEIFIPFLDKVIGFRIEVACLECLACPSLSIMVFL